MKISIGIGSHSARNIKGAMEYVQAADRLALGRQGFKPVGIAGKDADVTRVIAVHSHRGVGHVRHVACEHIAGEHHLDGMVPERYVGEVDGDVLRFTSAKHHSSGAVPHDDALGVRDGEGHLDVSTRSFSSDLNGQRFFEVHIHHLRR